MRIAVIGAGVVGVCTAHALSKANCEVHVFEQGSAAAQGASFAHGANYGERCAEPFFAPNFLKHCLWAVLGKPKTLHWQLKNSINDYGLLLKAALCARQSRHAQTQQDLLDLARYNAVLAPHFVGSEPLEFEQSVGLMVLHTQAPALEAAAAALKHPAMGNAQANKKATVATLLTPADAYVQQAALAQTPALLAASVYPSHEFGNCALFTKQRNLRHQQQGVHYWFNAQVSRLEQRLEQRLEHEQPPWRVFTHKPSQAMAAPREDVTDTQDTPDSIKHATQLDFDAVIVAAGAGSTALLAQIGLHFPVLNTHAYTVTLPLHDPIEAPKTSVLHEASGTYMTPIGNRIRLSGQHQLGAMTKPASRAYQALNACLHQWFPYASKMTQASYDCSSSSVAIDSKPIVGQTRLPGLWVNFAHGAAPFASSFACAQALADQLTNPAQAYNLNPFSPARFSKHSI